LNATLRWNPWPEPRFQEQAGAARKSRLIEINASGAKSCDVFETRMLEMQMTIQDIMVVALAVGAFSVFGVTLGFASWDESRRGRR
jgi:hypothetical protein